jgi:Protein of unknown function (DUF2786)
MGLMTEKILGNENILAKIKKLLALATSDNPEEAASAATKAQSMLIQHNISLAELDNFSLEKNEKVIQINTSGRHARNRCAWFGNRANIIAKANLCRILTNGAGLIWIGKPTNLEVAKYVLESVTTDLDYLCDLAFDYYKQVNTGYTVHGKTWKNTFNFGANKVLSERLQANLEALRSGVENVNALIVVNDRELDEFIRIKYPRLTTTTNTFRPVRSAYDAGKQAGREVQFRSGIGAGGSSGPKLIGR